MNIFLRAKHWQIFLVIFGIPFIVYAFMMASMISKISEVTAYGGEPDPEELMEIMMGVFSWMPILGVIISVVMYGWYWSIGVGLQYKLPQHITIKSGFFKVAIIVQLISMVGLMYVVRDMLTTVAAFMENPDGMADPAAFLGAFVVIMPLQLLSMVLMFYSFYFAAKVFKTAELQRAVTFSDFSAEFFLLWFAPIGVWIIQPKVNSMTGESHFSE